MTPVAAAPAPATRRDGMKALFQLACRHDRPGYLEGTPSPVVEALRQAQARGQVRSEADPGLAAFVLMCTSWFLFQTAAVTRRIPDLAATTDPERFASELARLLYHGLAPRVAPGTEDER